MVTKALEYCCCTDCDHELGRGLTSEKSPTLLEHLILKIDQNSGVFYLFIPPCEARGTYDIQAAACSLVPSVPDPVTANCVLVLRFIPRTRKRAREKQDHPR